MPQSTPCWLLGMGTHLPWSFHLREDNYFLVRCGGYFFVLRNIKIKAADSWWVGFVDLQIALIDCASLDAFTRTIDLLCLTYNLCLICNGAETLLD
mmetsp:Transcript_21550/g.44396  ORF Transcript_21550/g.44396 Transcript_21550/m.44396 type:complete len:96 (+) Transcript_21550:97-384(+)